MLAMGVCVRGFSFLPCPCFVSPLHFGLLPLMLFERVGILLLSSYCGKVWRGEMFYNFMINSQSFSSPMSMAYYFEKCFLVIPPLGEKEGQRGLERKNVHLQLGQGSDQVFSPVEQAFVTGNSLGPDSQWLLFVSPSQSCQGIFDSSP